MKGKMDKVYIIGEVGPNHNGSVETALTMIEKMAEAGVDCVKFQMTDPYQLYSDDSFKASYQKRNDKAKSVREMSLSYQLKREAHIALFQKCKESGVDYVCSAFDLESLIYLDEHFEMPYYKIASGEIFSLDMIDYISLQCKPIILSTGMATYDEVEVALNLLNRNFPKDITLLHCISNYPAKYEEVNLRNMLSLKERFGCKVGFSDHTVGNDCAIASAAMGASMIEKHVTLDKNANGPDHKASIDILELESLVSAVRHIEIALGSYDRQFSESQREISRVARKSLVTKHAMRAGEIIKEEDICFKRPGIGFLPIEQDLVIGHRLIVDIEKDRVIRKEFIN
ncbi:N-acetylneuraminate synthase family protein [Butyricimonas virosa]|uniref:N-acetylneuraminate synthase family protein n=1 Tax=Butyricimonas virosa TaxID=544645 RepID=UPI00243038D8|nr:N-acetylneuraminate synthase family protein [Butyricimonas virosa]